MARAALERIAASTARPDPALLARCTPGVDCVGGIVIVSYAFYGLVQQRVHLHSSPRRSEASSETAPVEGVGERVQRWVNRWGVLHGSDDGL